MFNKLVHLLHLKSSYEVKQSYNSLMWLSQNSSHLPRDGSSYWNLLACWWYLLGPEKCLWTSIKRVRDLFLDDMNSCIGLNLLSLRQHKKGKRSFKTGIHSGGINTIDAFLCKNQVPHYERCNMNPKSYCSDHYSTHGLNGQAVCDVRCWFIFFAVAAPGSTANQTAFEKTALEHFVQSLLTGIHNACWWFCLHLDWSSSCSLHWIPAMILIKMPSISFSVNFELRLK